MSKKIIFKGAATALVTPMKEGRIDYNALDFIINKQRDAGISALVVGGTTGEAATLSYKERVELYKFARDRWMRGKLILGIGTNDTRTALEYTRLAAEVGCDGTLAVTPYYNKGTYRGVVEHYKALAREADIPLILYNVPSRTGVNLTLSQLEELAKEENIVAIKEASDSVDRLTELRKFGKDLHLYAGNDSQIFATLALGGLGVISVISNLFPKRIEKTCRLFFEKNYAESMKIQLELFDFIRLMFKETNPTPIKYAMSLVGLCTPEVRLPLAMPEEKTMQEIREALSAIQKRLQIDF